MTQYRLRDTGEVKTKSQLVSEHPNLSLPKVWSANTYDSLGVDPIAPSFPPEPSDDFKVFGRGPLEQDANGHWRWTWIERDMFFERTEIDEEGVERVVTVQEQKDAKVAADNAALAERARATRNALLQETDHYALSDLTMTDEMTAYRQSLRDVPQQADFPATITWPTKPE